MTPERFRRIEQLFFKAEALPVAERSAFLEQETGSDLALREEVERLLAAPQAELALTGLRESLGGAAPRWGDNALVGQTVQGYRLTREIGSGGMGVVFEAEQDRPIRRRVALKLIKAGMDSREVVARFESERQALALMSHPNVASVHDGGTTEQGRPYFVMEYVDGQPITTYCDDKRLSVRQRLELFIQVCDAVQHAHQKGLIHRDLKPTNILVTTDGAPKVIDFGVAKAVQQRLTDITLHTQHGQLVGTPEYMSPEQAEQDGRDVDTRADVYSLGVVLYELLTGVLPFARKTTPRTDADHVRRPSTRLSGEKSTAADSAARRGADARALTKLLRGDLDWIAMKCLERDRERRYESAAALAQDLGRYLRSEAVLAGPPSALYRFSKFTRRNRAAVTAGALAVVVLLGATAGMSATTVWALRERDAAEVARAEAETRRAEAEKAQAEAVKQRDQFHNLSEFQHRAISSISPSLLGLAIRDGLRTQVRRDGETFRPRDAGATPRRLTEDEILAELTQLDAATAAIDFRSVGRFVICEGVVQPMVDKAERELSDKPVITGRLFGAYANVYDGLGLHDRSLTQWRRVVEIRRSISAEDHWYVLQAEHNLGIALKRTEKYDEAEEIYRKVLAMEGRTVMGPYCPPAFVRCNLANVRRRLGDWDEAEKLLREALAALVAEHGEEHEIVTGTLANLCWTHLDRGDYESAEQVMRRARDMGMRLQVGPERQCSLDEGLACVLAARGKLREAVACCAQARQLADAAYDSQHPEAASVMCTDAAIQSSLANYDDARRLLYDAWSVYSASGRDRHTDVASLLACLGDVLIRLGDLDAAESVLNECLAIRRAVFGDEHLSTVSTREELARVMLSRGDLENAAAEMRDVLAARRRLLKGDHPRLAETLLRCGEVALARDELDEADAFLCESLAMGRRTLREGHPLLAEILCILAQTQTRAGDLHESSRLLSEALTIRRDVFGPSHVFALDCLEQLTSVRLSAGATAAAVETIDDIEQAIGEDDVSSEDERAVAAERLASLRETLR